MVPEPSVRNAIAKIEVGLSRGTGFLVANGLVLTAMHVVADRRQATSLAPHPGTIQLTFPERPPFTASICDGLWDARTDWALLKFEQNGDAAEDWVPLPLADLREIDIDWWTFGFPESNPEGLWHKGQVRSCGGVLQGVSIYQLYCEDAAAGKGERVKGFSGAPVLVGNAVVGILRYALMEDSLSVDGAMYACPVDTVLSKADKLLPVPDPCAGLPGLPNQILPAEPFRYLAWFTSQEAEVFFGRNREISEVYKRLTDKNEPPILLFYGQTGVGKSSFLDAGLQPRLQWFHEVIYLRRDAGKTLLGTLRNALKAKAASSLAEAWQAVEQTAGKPLIVFFDQIEEIHTHPNDDAPNELEQFANELKKLFDGTIPIEGKLVLSFRKEWFPEIEKQMEVSRLSWSKVFLQVLDREAVVEAVKGLTLTQRLRNRYNLKVENGLAGTIADRLLMDRDSPVAPTLQILLTKLWQKATAISRSAPVMTQELFQTFGNELGLGDFLDEQLEKLRIAHPEWVESGLALDLLRCHVSSNLTVQERTEQDLVTTEYPHRAAEIPQLLHNLEELFLLTDSSRDNGRKATRLCHDTLAPLVQQRFAASELPGQKARRLLESHATEFDARGDAGLLDDSALKVVGPGRSGMRAFTQSENLLVAASVARQKRNALIWNVVWAAAAVLVLGIIISAVGAFRQRNTAREAQKTALEAKRQADIQRHNADRARDDATTAQAIAVEQKKTAEDERQVAEEEKNQADLRYEIGEATADLQSANPPVGLVKAVRVVGRSKQLLGYVSNPAVKTLEEAMDTARERIVLQRPARAGAISADGVVALVSNGVSFASASSGQEIPSPEIREIIPANPACPAFSPDNRLFTVATSNGVLFWMRKAGRGQVIFRGARGFLATVFSGDSSHLAAVTNKGEILIADADGKTVAQHQTEGLHDLSHAAIAFRSGGEGYVAASGAKPNDQKVYLFDLTGKLLFVQEQHRHPVTAIAVTSAGSIPLASADANGNLFLWRSTGILAADPARIHGASVRALAFGPSGLVIASVASDASVNFTTPTGRTAETGQHDADSEVNGVVFSPDGAEVLVTSDEKSRLFDTRGIRIDKSIPVDLNPPDIEGIEPGGQTLAVMGGKQTVAIAEKGGRVVLWHYPTNYSARIDTGGEISGMAFSDDERLFVTASPTGQLKLWDRTGNRAGSPWKVADDDFAFSLDPNGKYVVTVDGAALRLWDAGSRRQLHSIQDDEARQINEVQFLRDGAREPRFMTLSESQMQLWTIRGDRMIKAESAQVLPDVPDDWNIFPSAYGAELLAGEPVGYDGKARQGGRIQLFGRDGHSAGPSQNPHDAANTVLGAVVFPDGKTTASFVKYGQNVTFCRFEHGEPCVPISVGGHVGGILALALSPDGKTLASVGSDRTVRLLHAGLQGWLNTACERLSAHPIFHAADYLAGLDPQIVRDAKATCRDVARVSE